MLKIIQKNIILLISVFILFVPYSIKSQELQCDMDSCISIIKLKFFGDDVSLDKEYEIRINDEFSEWATPKEKGIWEVNLIEKINFNKCEIVPIKEGYEIICEKRDIIKEGKECVGYFNFKFRKIWQVKIFSIPNTINIDCLNCEIKETWSTPCLSPKLKGLNSELSLKIYANTERYYEELLTINKFPKNKKIIHDKNEIYRKIYPQAYKNPSQTKNSTFYSIMKEIKKRENIKLEQVEFKLDMQ